MIAITNTGPSQMELRDWPMPEPGPGEVRIRTRACGICHLDLKMISGWPRTGYPSIPGHEWSGVVDALGADVDEAWLGEPVVAENLLADGSEVGFERPGGFAEYFLTEARGLYRLPWGFSFDLAALIEPLAVSVRAMRRLGALEGSRVLVLGDGPLGLMALMLLRAHQIREVLVVGGVPGRLALATELGAADVYNFHSAGEEDLAVAIRTEFGGLFDYVVEASGSPLAAETALRVAKPGGRVLVFGDYEDARLDFPWNFILHQELEILGSNASAAAWPEALQLAVNGRLPLERLVSHRLPVREFARGLELARTHREGAIKVVLEW